MRLTYRFVLLFGLALIALPARAQEPGDLVATELLVNPANPILDADGEWVELFNTTNRPIDLRGWAVRDSAASGLRPLHVIASSVIIPARGFVVLGNNANTTANGGVPVTYSYGGALTFANSLDRFVLLSPDSTAIDGVRYASAATSAQDGISRELLDTASDNSLMDTPNWASALSSSVYGAGGRGTPLAAGQTKLAAARPTVPSAASVTSAGAGYRLLSAPVSGLTVRELAALNLVQGLPDEYPAGSPNLFTGYSGIASAANNGFTPPSSTGSYLLKGRGFFWYMYTAGGPGAGASGGTSRRADLPLTLQTTGFLRTADVATTFRVADRAGATDQFYLMGNPFNAAFDLDGLATSSGTLGNVFQFYDPATGYTFRTRNGIIDDGSAADDAPVWQGFFAEFATAPSFPLTFTYSAAAQVAPAPPRAGQASASRHVGLVLDGVTADGTVAHDEAASLYFAADATEGWDAYDASKLTPPDGAAALLAPVGPGMDGADRPLAQRSLPVDLIAPVTVPLSFSAAAGTYTLTSAAFDGVPPTWQVSLTDHVTGTVTALRAGAVYAFESDAVTASGRFSVTVLPGATTATETGLGSAYALAPVAPNPSTSSARTLLRVQAAQTVRAEVVDVLGRRVQTVFEGVVTPGTPQAIEVASGVLPAGVYVLHISGTTFSATRTFSIVR